MYEALFSNHRFSFLSLFSRRKTAATFHPHRPLCTYPLLPASHFCSLSLFFPFPFSFLITKSPSQPPFERPVEKRELGIPSYLSKFPFYCLFHELERVLVNDDDYFLLSSFHSISQPKRPCAPLYFFFPI